MTRKNQVRCANMYIYVIHVSIMCIHVYIIRTLYIHRNMHVTQCGTTPSTYRGVIEILHDQLHNMVYFILYHISLVDQITNLLALNMHQKQRWLDCRLVCLCVCVCRLQAFVYVCGLCCIVSVCVFYCALCVLCVCVCVCVCV